MGGGQYSYDVAREVRSTNRDAFTYAGYGTDSGSARSRGEVHPLLNPKGNIRECMNNQGIVIALDVTRSRGNDSRIMYEKLPMFIGQLEMKGYVEGATISFCAIGDATTDNAPIQVSQFEADNRLDEALSYFWLEEGGGGTGQESYELVAYYYAKHSHLACNDRGEKGYFFIIGDEGFYPKVKKNEVKEFLGFDIDEDMDSKEIFRLLQEKFHVFFIYPKKSWEERKSDIDAEIQQRVEAAGGQYKNVDIRASLIWDNRNDLDLHIITPSGEEIYYAHKQSQCRGWLDVDMNVQGETLKPVENIRWSKGDAPKGRYKVFVQNYKFHEDKKAPTPFKVEVEVAGKIKYFEGTISPNKEIGRNSNLMIYEFDYDPATAHQVEPADPEAYEKYNDEAILQQWSEVIPQEHILLIDDPNTIIDVMLGALSIVAANNDLDDYLVDLQSRDQTQPRIAQTQNALQQLAMSRAITKVETKGLLPSKKSGKERAGKSKRL